MTARTATEDSDVCGIRIPAGTVDSIPIQAIQQSTRDWGYDSAYFELRRWLKDCGRPLPPPTVWLPFLHGPRGCIGNRVALMEMKVMVASVILRGLSLKLSPGCEPPAMSVILVPKGLKLHVAYDAERTASSSRRVVRDVTNILD